MTLNSLPLNEVSAEYAPELSDAEFVWVDFETNQLHKDGPVVPFEVGVRVTDKDGRTIDEMQRIILPGDWQTFASNMSDYVNNMHSTSGLLQDMAELHSAVIKGIEAPASPNCIDILIHGWLTYELQLPKETFPMCGSTVHFDRRVMEEHMPLTHNWFHYRDIDVSTVKELCRRYNPAVYEQRPANTKTHRPLADITASITEFQFYRQNFLFEA